MSKDEKILYSIAGLGLLLIAIINIVRLMPDNDDNNVSYNQPDVIITNGARHNNYLTFNKPYAFSPPVANLLPQTIQSFLGVRTDNNANNNQTTTANDDCGCDI